MAIPAAQYVRMSTEDQQFSIANQRDRIAEYAARHDFSIVRTYEDAGRSGVVIKRRGGLMQLLKDVVSGDASYKARAPFRRCCPLEPAHGHEKR